MHVATINLAVINLDVSCYGIRSREVLVEENFFVSPFNEIFPIYSCIVTQTEKYMFIKISKVKNICWEDKLLAFIC